MNFTQLRDEEGHAGFPEQPVDRTNITSSQGGAHVGAVQERGIEGVHRYVRHGYGNTSEIGLIRERSLDQYGFLLDITEIEGKLGGLVELRGPHCGDHV